MSRAREHRSIEVSRMDTKAPSPSRFAAPSFSPGSPGAGEGRREGAFPLPPRGTTGGDKKARARRGFTLLELLVVLAILSLIAAFAGPRVLKLLGGAKTDAAGIQIANLVTTLDLYHLGSGGYPDEQDGLEALLPLLNNKSDALIDPWGNPYRYRYPGEHGEFDLYSLGADDAEGGEGEDRDVTSW
jgi:general secretion pathway protein G